MSKCKSSIVKPLSKERLLRIIKLQGLQTCIFDRELFILEWHDLEYQFHICEARILLYRVIVRKDVVLCREKKVARYIY